MLCRMAWIFLKMIQWISSDENAVRKSRGKAVRLELKICDGTTQRVFLIFSSSWGYSLLVIHCSGRWRRMEKNNNNVRKEWLLITVNQPTAKARPKRALRCVAIGPPFTTTLHSNSDLDFFFSYFTSFIIWLQTSRTLWSSAQAQLFTRHSQQWQCLFDY